MEADEIVKLLNRAAVEGMQDYVDEALLALAEALCCDECGGTGIMFCNSEKANPLLNSSYGSCMKCQSTRSAVRRWKEGRNA